MHRARIGEWGGCQADGRPGDDRGTAWLGSGVTPDRIGHLLTKVALERNFEARQTIVHYFVEVSENLRPTSRDNINAVAEIATPACRNLETWLVSEARRNSPAASHWRRDEIGP